MSNESNTTGFLRSGVSEDVASGKFATIRTRFPPEPNGFLHIGHAKAISLDFGIASEFGGRCGLRFDDTNPTKEEASYVRAIKDDIRWLGYDWGDDEFYASDYFEQLYEYALVLIGKGCAYVDDLSPEEIRAHRGTLTEAGTESPHRGRTIEENLSLFGRMKDGEFAEGERVLRAKIDMSSPNMNMRDPVMYRILHAPHHRTGTSWCIYPMYDWAHGQSDSIEGVSHSLCDLAYEDHRPLYDWFLDRLEIYHPRQIEFNRLNLSHTVLSKRRLKTLVDNGHVSGWDDPRMPTLAGMRRRGYTAASIRRFVERVGVSKTRAVVDISLLEYFIREELNTSAPRAMAVLDPVRLIIENYPEGEREELTSENNPEDESQGTRQLPFGRELLVERGDFRIEAPKKYYRLAPGREVRLKHAYYVTCVGFESDEDGRVTEIRCTYDPETRGGWSDDGRKVKGTLHWVDAATCGTAEIRLFDRLFDKENPDDADEESEFLDSLNSDSLEVLERCAIERSLVDATPGTRYQFLRQGYFAVDSERTDEGEPVFNRIVSLRDSWAKIENQPSRS